MAEEPAVAATSETPQLPRRSPSPRRTVLAAVALVAVFFVVVSAAGSSRAACALCHRAQAAAQGKTAHKDVHCYACHLERGVWSLPGQKGAEIFGMYPRALLRTKPSVPARQISNRRCLTCHSPEWTQLVSGRRLRLMHSSCAAGLTCDTCHAQTAHPRAVRWTSGPKMQDCTGCHSERHVSVRCATCHIDKRDRGGSYRSPWRTPHGSNWARVHGMGQLQSCAVCHEAGYCAKCHGLDVPHAADFADRHGALARNEPSSCTTCHKGGRLCFGCHQIEMPHPTDFALKHMSVAEGRVDPSCFRCHAPGDCDTCHELHIHPDLGDKWPSVLAPKRTRDASSGAGQ